MLRRSHTRWRTGHAPRRAGRAQGPPGRDRGSVALWAVIVTFAVLVLLTFVVDGGQLMNAKERAADVAEQAARAAANDIDITQLRSGQVAISPQACDTAGPAASLVASYAKGTGLNAVIPASYRNQPGCKTGTMVTGTGPQNFATVTVEVTTNPVIPLGIFGSYQIPATETAFLDCGVTQGVAC
jgi:Flp pilus assembly protein TadG